MPTALPRRHTPGMPNRPCRMGVDPKGQVLAGLAERSPGRGGGAAAPEHRRPAHPRRRRAVARDRSRLQGRDRDVAALRTALMTGRGSLLVLRGPAGIGRSAVLDAVGRSLRAEGVRVLPVRFGAAPVEPGADRYGIASLVHSVRDRFEAFADAGLADSLTPVARLAQAGGGDAGGWTPSMVTELGVLFDRLARGGRTALLADDAHLVAEPAPLLTAARRCGFPVLATCRQDTGPEPGTAELRTAADRVLTLGPLAEGDALALLRRAAGTRLDEAAEAALRAALGPLFTDPGTLLGTLADLQRGDRLTVFRGRLCLRAPAEAIALPAGHPLLARVAEAGPLAPWLLSSVAAWDGVSVDDLPLLAETAGAELTDCGRTLDRLIEAGVLVADRAGRVHCRCPALAAAAVDRTKVFRGAGLHAAIAERLLARQRRDAAVDSVALADHIARGSTALAPGADMTARLLDLAGAAAREEPRRAAVLCAAVLHRLPPGGAEHARVLNRLLTLVLRTGQYELLREAIAGATEPDGSPGALDPRAQTRAAAMLVALHTGEPPVGQSVRALLDEELPGPGTTGFSEWWFGARQSGPGVPRGSAPSRWIGVPGFLAADEMEVVQAALSGDADACARAWRATGRPAPCADLDRLCAAAAVVDVATVFHIVLGARYRLPDTGVLGAYRRVVGSHRAADWSRAMSAVRELELSGPADTLVHHAARLFAADICAARGEFRQAAEWLAAAAPAPRLAGLRAWARTGLYHHMGQHRRAIRHARHVSRRLQRAGRHACLDRLLTRAVGIAAYAEDPEAAGQLLEQTERLHRQDGRPRLTESVHLARALAGRDVVHARVAADLARERGDRSLLLESAPVVARFADDPGPWLREAHDLATGCGAAVLLERIRAVTRERGVPAPRARARRRAAGDTERRIVELIGAGLTNRQIAQRLALSEKTVEHYLTRLFARTGCRSRVELAAASLSGRLTTA
ncbi:LuxR family transcriptional regulator [Streptomyces harbinensis]|uniref:helix-turn-helix transcriptional regulator n=1 Tax=Streptomyces harbinensis TaxID=1176198 RepID=UPI0031B59724